MGVFAMVLSALVGLLMIIGDVHCDESTIKSFVKSVRSNIPDDIFSNLFSVSFTDDDDVTNAVKQALKEFGEEDNVKIPKTLVKELEEDAVKVEDEVTSTKFSQAIASAVAHSLSSAGILNSSNAGVLGKSFADQLVKADKAQVKEEDVKYTLPAVADATGKFFNQMGLSGNLQDVLLLAANIIKEGKKL